MTTLSVQASGVEDGHAVTRLRAARLAASAKPFVARGSGGVRCDACRVTHSHCLCALKPSVPTRAGVCLLMGDIEALMPDKKWVEQARKDAERYSKAAQWRKANGR